MSQRHLDSMETKSAYPHGTESIIRTSDGSVAVRFETEWLEISSGVWHIHRYQVQRPLLVSFVGWEFEGGSLPDGCDVSEVYIGVYAVRPGLLSLASGGMDATAKLANKRLEGEPPIRARFLVHGRYR